MVLWPIRVDTKRFLRLTTIKVLARRNKHNESDSMHNKTDRHWGRVSLGMDRTRQTRLNKTPG